MKRKIRTLFVASEVVPFAKTGGLADVSGALPKALARLGSDIKVVMPRYYTIDKNTLEHIPMALGVDMGAMGELWAGVYRTYLPDSEVEIYFIDHEAFYGRSGLYHESEAYEDNDKRFVFLSKAALQLCRALNFKPDIVHANDWHTATLPILLKTSLHEDDFFKESASVLTVHNLQHQGVFGKELMNVLGVGWEHFTPMELEAMDNVNLLKGGITFCDALTTVSKKYAREIQTPEFGFGLDEHLRAHAHKLYGILNGIDYTEWNPSVDKYIAVNYDVDTLEKKKKCKQDLQKRFNLPQREDVPLIGFVGRFVTQKGIELIATVIDGLLEMDIQVVMLGNGEFWAENFFSQVAAGHPDKFGCYIGYSNELAHQIEAGSDLFLMPSLFEPCGLNQIYSLRYGTLPIVRATGGLDDTIVNYDPQTKEGNGFKFYHATPDALYHTVKWAVETYHQEKDDFLHMQKNAMREHFSWLDSGTAYLDIYKALYYHQKIQRYK
ncbi:glycogen synthase GlgA [Sulfurovum sp. NBC37-1]|uniref:glycogen synthase GlgA n=1 Tax=Sulfurovum sp. (strain NBC37-1) TaxID=387093 RepID=UPI0001587BA1|nr:glycogen synthase GlgA [Sulfurovum sp. NBC37-1]BAF72222.1 glycogen synthase [Sulfurovum sp. NBC37-1]